jgi:dihydroorotase
MNDLAVTGGRLLDPGQGIDAIATIGISGATVTDLSVDQGTDPAPCAVARGGGGVTLDATGLLVTPGLIDLHTHLYEGVSHYGIDPDTHCLSRGVTTAVDAGSSGAQTFPGLRRYVIERSRTQILAFLHIAVQGMITNMVGELEDTRWASPAQAIARAREHPDVIVGIKVRLGFQMVGDDPAPAMRLAREAAEALGLPLMVHVIDMRPSISWLLPYLDHGDIVTHCFHGHEGGILGADGQLRPDVWRARERGVRFDVGHGAGSFSYQVARSAITQGFPPDTVSSDLHAHNVAGPVYDQATTLSKLLHAGMPLTEVIRATTATPALAIRRADSIGSLRPGRQADLTAFELRSARWPPAPEGQRARALLPGSAGRPRGKEVAAGVRYSQ